MLTSLLPIIILVVQGQVKAFECYTGDGEVLRRKHCKNIPGITPDVCFKKEGDSMDDQMNGYIQRGCFVSLISELITSSADPGCHPIPKKYGGGVLCLCYSELCNSSPSITKPSYAALGIILTFITLTFNLRTFL